jgi:hypothetical protein
MMANIRDREQRNVSEQFHGISFRKFEFSPYIKTPARGRLAVTAFVD